MWLKDIFFIIIIFFTVNSLQAQNENLIEDTTVLTLQEYDEFDLPSNFHRKYRLLLRRAKRVYPLALHAASIIDSLDNSLAEEEKNRKKKKIVKNTHKELKEDFKFLLKDLYVSEGIVLSKLIYRETGLTVSEIIEKYKSGTQSFVYTSLASFFEQDLDAKYDPQGEDFVLECVIRDLNSGKIPYDSKLKTLDKGDYKEKQKAYKKSKKENKKKIKKIKKEAKKIKKYQKKNDNE